MRANLLSLLWWKCDSQAQQKSRKWNEDHSQNLGRSALLSCKRIRVVTKFKQKSEPFATLIFLFCKEEDKNIGIGVGNDGSDSALLLGLSRLSWRRNSCITILLQPTWIQRSTTLVRMILCTSCIYVYTRTVDMLTCWRVLWEWVRITYESEAYAKSTPLPLHCPWEPWQGKCNFACNLAASHPPTAREHRATNKEQLSRRCWLKLWWRTDLHTKRRTITLQTSSWLFFALSKMVSLCFSRPFIWPLLPVVLLWSTLADFEHFLWFSFCFSSPYFPALKKRSCRHSEKPDSWNHM